MKKLLIAAPWITASAAAIYAVSQWPRLPARMAVHFTSFMGTHANGWHAKTTAVPVLLFLMFGILTLFTVMLLNPERIHVRGGALSDPVEDRRRAARTLLAAHIFVGIMLPVTLVYVIGRNL
jgi:uncharacterized membrane protein